MKTLVFLTLFVACAFAHTTLFRQSPDDSSSSSSEEVIFTQKAAVPSSESSSSEEVIFTKKALPIAKNRGRKHEKHIQTRSFWQTLKDATSAITEFFFRSNYHRPDDDTRWEKYKIQYKLKFDDPADEEKAKARFVKNRAKVLKHRDTNPNSSIDIDLNKFAIMSSKEFRRRKMGLTPETRPEVRSFFSSDMLREKVPDYYDSRRTPGAVTYIREQGECQGCWAFATVATLETVFFMKYKKTYKLSEQQLLDCDGYNEGCDGGTMDAAFNYIKRNGGINPQKLYPFEEEAKDCRASPLYNRPIFITDVKGFPKPARAGKPGVQANKIEEMMKVATFQHGAVAIGIDAEHMQFYSGGIYTGPCTIGINHGVAIVGYGKCPDTGLDYWIIKNSWGTNWGERGYLRLARGNNTCGVAQMPSVPIIADNIDLTNVKTDEQVDDEN
ncbi:uncharacterized protein LOC134828727 [Culicoides brevitarsis]|uniref:uncharacterized protein LOC134828727 n=1 Tax=Culicoides brevitarsis TaxID=469753 RepID=UPI00307C707B